MIADLASLLGILFLLSSLGRAFVLGVDSVVCSAAKINLSRVAFLLVSRVFRRRQDTKQSYVRASIPSNPFFLPFAVCLRG